MTAEENRIIPSSSTKIFKHTSSLVRRGLDDLRRIATNRNEKAVPRFDTSLLPDLMEIIAYHIEAHYRWYLNIPALTDVTPRIIEDLGEWSRPYLRPAWDALHGTPLEVVLEGEPYETVQVVREAVSRIRDLAEQNGVLDWFASAEHPQR